MLNSLTQKTKHYRYKGKWINPFINKFDIFFEILNLFLLVNDRWRRQILGMHIYLKMSS